MTSQNSISGYCFATSRATDRKSPSEYFMMFALCTTVTARRPLFFAYSNA